MAVENTLGQMREDFRQSQAELVKMLDSVDLDALHRPRDEEKWSLAIMLAHLTEARPYFARQAELFLTNPEPIVGRTPDNEQRVEAIINAQRTQLRTEQLKQQLLDSYASVLHLFDMLKDSDLTRDCTHARLGEITLGKFIQSNIVEHDQTHVAQAKSFLGQT